MVLFCLLLWGLVYLWTGSAIFAVPRQVWYAVAPGALKPLAYCPSCCGTWIGFALALLGAWPFDGIIWAPVEAAVASAGLMSIVSYWVPHANNAYSLEQQHQEHGGHHDESAQS